MKFIRALWLKLVDNKKTVSLYALSYLLPFILMYFLLYSQGVSWNGDRNTLASDGFHQFVDFNVGLRDILHGTDSLFYSFKSALGLNFYVLMSYYLGSFLSPLVFFFKMESMANAIYLLTLIKFGLIGISTATLLRKVYEKLSWSFVLLLSTSYAMMSFTVTQLGFSTWLDVFIVVPLILLGLHNLITGKGKKLYFFTLVALFIQNFYFGFMMALFLVLWFLTQLSWDFENRKKRSIDFLVVSGLAGLTSAIMLLPTIYDLTTHGQSTSVITRWTMEDAWYFDFFAKNFVGAYDTLKYHSLPMIYVGLLPFLLMFVFFTLKSISVRVKASYALLVFALFISFYILPLNLLWQGMHAPNMFLHRYAWVFTTIVLLMAAEVLSRVKELDEKRILYPTGGLLVAFLLVIAFRKHYDFLKTSNYVLTLGFLFAYALVLVAMVRWKKQAKTLSMLTLALVLVEMTTSAYMTLTALKVEWNFPTNEYYLMESKEIPKLVEETKEANQTFYRMERTADRTKNDNMKYGYNGISQFSSIRNKSSNSTLSQLGFRSDGENQTVSYRNNTILMDSIFGIKYNINQGSFDKYGYIPVDTINGVSLYQNTKASQLALLTAGRYEDVQFINNYLANQSSFINRISGLNLNYFTELQQGSSTGVETVDNKYQSTNKENGTITVTYQVHIPANTQVYMHFSGFEFTEPTGQIVHVEADGNTFDYNTNREFMQFNIGNFSRDVTATVKVTFPGQSKISYASVNFYGLNINNYVTAMNTINSRKVTVTTKKNKVTADYTAQEDASLLFTLPYDKGWTATLNSKKVEVKQAQTGFMKVDVPKGSGTVVLKFVPRGFKLGLICTIIGLAAFYVYDDVERAKRNYTNLKQKLTKSK